MSSENIELWEPWAVQAIPESGDIAIDVGAGWGVYTVDLASRFRKVIAIEPHPTYAAGLKELAIPNVEVLQVAAYMRNGMGVLDLYGHPSHTSSHRELTVVDRGPIVTQLHVELTRLDKIELDGRVDFIKVDVEGAELEVWKGATGINKEFRPRWFIEVHSHRNLELLAPLFHEAGYGFRRLHQLGTEAYWLEVNHGERKDQEGKDQS